MSVNPEAPRQEQPEETDTPDVQPPNKPGTTDPDYDDDPREEPPKEDQS